MVKKSASGVLAVLPTFGLTDVPLFAAFALTYGSVRSARQNGCGLPFDVAQDRAGRTFLNIPSRFGADAS